MAGNLPDFLPKIQIVLLVFSFFIFFFKKLTFWSCYIV